MAYLELDKGKLQHNYAFLGDLFKKHRIEWGVVSKLLCGNRLYLKELLSLGVREILDSRISNLRTIKSIAPNVETVYIKPPARRVIKNLVKYADASFNTELETIRLISEEAGRQNKIHKVIIMIEMGDLREGVMGEKLMDFYGSVFKLPNIEVSGIGTNLNCLSGVMPSHDKLIQLSLYEQLIEAKFNRKINWVTGGSSVTIPLLFKRMVPAGINHFRIGETLFTGKNLVSGKILKGMKSDVFRLYAEIIELSKKPLVPTGELGKNVAGEEIEINESDYGKSSFRAILDLGLLDIDISHLFPVDQKIQFYGASSDMIVVDLGDNRQKYKPGDLIPFGADYMGILNLMNSDYIEKKIV